MKRTILFLFVFLQLLFCTDFAQNDSAKSQQIEFILSRLSIEKRPDN